MDFCRAFDEWASQARIMGALLATFKRDGWEHAFNELQEALFRKHVIEGETVPLDRTTPVTICMFEPEITFDLLRWASTHEIDDLERLVGQPDADPDFVKLRESFPLLKDLTVEECKKFDDILGSVFSDRVFQNARDVTTRVWGPHRDWDNDKLWLRLESSQGGYRLLRSGRAFAFMLVGMDQAKALGGFSREEQGRMATWRINLPTMCVEHMGGTPKNRFWVQFREESDHDPHSSAPVFSSVGTSRGMGASIVTNCRNLAPGKFIMTFDVCSCLDDGCSR
jgi:hypothetical protein